MRQTMVAMALAGVLAASWVVPTQAQQNGVVIQNNGVDSSQSAAGADNVRISRAPGNSSSTNGAGLNNEVGTVVNEKSRDRKERKNRDNAEEMVAPVEEAAPAEGDLQAYTDEGEWVEPAQQELAPEPIDTAVAPIKLPNTGAGTGGFLPLGALVSALTAAGFAVTGLRRRFIS